MSDKVFNLGRILDWTVGSVVASFFTFAVTGFAGYLNGSFARICEFAKTNTFDLVILTVISFSLGSFVCLIMAALVRKRKIKSIEAEHAREIERIRSEYEKQLAELRKPDEARTPSGRLNVNLAAIRCTDHGIIAAAVAAFDDERHIIPLGKYEKAVRKSINNRDGIFALSKTAFCGMPGDEDGRFYLTQTWFKGMDDHEIIDAMRSIAEKWEAAH